MVPVRPEQLHGRWVHAHEEDTPEQMVFRPADYDLPPARGRAAFELRPDGTFREVGLGAADVPDEASGTWALEDDDRIVLGEGAPGGVPRTMRVVAAETDRLVVEK
jgi:hypothetical protein